LLGHLLGHPGLAVGHPAPRPPPILFAVANRDPLLSAAPLMLIVLRELLFAALHAPLARQVLGGVAPVAAWTFDRFLA
jgi:hypothetical protein